MSSPLTFPILIELAKVKGAKFASFTYKNAKGEVATHTLILGFDTRNLYEKDLATVDAMLSTLSGIELEAAQAIHASLAVSLAGGIGNNPAFTHGADMRGEGNETYTHIDGLPNVTIHNVTGDLYVKGLAERKVVHIAGTYKEVKSKPLTLAKQAIDKGLRKSAIRQFCLGNIASVRLNGETLELATEFDALIPR